MRISPTLLAARLLATHSEISSSGFCSPMLFRKFVRRCCLKGSTGRFLSLLKHLGSRHSPLSRSLCKLWMERIRHTLMTRLCIFMRSDPQQLVQWVTRAAQSYNETCSKYGLTLNFAPGKSEAMMVLRGKDTPLAREQAEAGLKIGPDCTLSVVWQCPHVGTLCADTGTHMPDIRKHCKSTTQAYIELAGTFYARSAILCDDRVRGAGSMVFSRLLGNGHVWDPWPHGALQALSTVLEHGSMQSLEVLARNWRGTPAALSDDALREAMQVDSVPALLRKKSTSLFCEVGARWSSEVSLVAYSERWRLCCFPLGGDDDGPP